MARNRRFLWNLKRAVICLLVAVVIVIICMTKMPSSLPSLESRSTEIVIENILANEPKDGRNIFFIDSIRMYIDLDYRNLNTRQACAVESAGE